MLPERAIQRLLPSQGANHIARAMHEDARKAYAAALATRERLAAQKPTAPTTSATSPSRVCALPHSRSSMDAWRKRGRGSSMTSRSLTSSLLLPAIAAGYVVDSRTAAWPLPAPRTAALSGWMRSGTLVIRDHAVRVVMFVTANAEVVKGPGRG